MLVAFKCPDVSFSYLKGLLPFQCLVVPFQDPKHRDSLCDFLHLDRPGSECLLVNAEKDFMLRGGDPVENHLLSWIKKPTVDFQFFLRRLAKSTWPVSLEQARYPEHGDCYLAKQFQAFEPEYPEDLTMVVNELKKTCPIVIGQSFDVMSLWKSEKGELNYLQRNGGDQVVEVREETFKGKYIMVCCVYVPVFREGLDSCPLQRLVNTCSELYSTRHDFEMVLVAKLNKLTEFEAVFDHFVSGFLPSCPCLVVPFNDSKRRDFICKYLDFDGFPKCLILDENRTVCVNQFPVFLSEHGADAFPFTREHLQKVLDKDFQLWEGPSTSNLEQLLHRSDVVDRINSAGVWEVKTISELSTELVGLFLCFAGDYIPTFHKVFEQC